MFNAKKNQFVHELVDLNIFGSVKAWMYVIEFQKRSLPHMHMIVCLNNPINTEAKIDRIIQAYIPDQTTEPILHQRVVTHMMHGPCGELNKNAVCMKEAKCGKRFPKPFQEITQLQENSYPTYKR